jgi:saccharopine dehydrogenase-like NADP-dependent oxidoreductase
VQANGTISFNECGVDPGLDHMSACKIFDEVKGKGGKIITFLS